MSARSKMKPGPTIEIELTGEEVLLATEALAMLSAKAESPTELTECYRLAQRLTLCSKDRPAVVSLERQTDQ